MLLSDSSELEADKYTHGPNGLIVAQCLSPQNMMEIALPDTMLEDGNIFAAYEAMALQERTAPRSVETKAVKAARPVKPT